MGGWTTSYHWGGVKRGDLRMLLRHNARDIDRKHGMEVAHGNPSVHGHLTDLNRTYTMREGEFVELDSIDEIIELIDEKCAAATPRVSMRVNKATGKKEPVQIALGKRDAVLTEFVLQVDPVWVRQGVYTEEEMLTSKEARLRPAVEVISPEKFKETVRLLRVMRDQVIREFGAENVAFISEHLDETNPHIQMGMVPIAEDGTVNKTKVFHGGNGSEGRKSAQQFYRDLHDRMRETLREHGYEATMERVSEGKHRSIDEFKAKKDRDHEEWEALQRAQRAATEAEKANQQAQVLADQAWNERREAEQLRSVGRAAGFEEGKAEGLRQGLEEGFATLQPRLRKVETREKELDAREEAIAARERDAEALVRDAEAQAAVAARTAREKLREADKLDAEAKERWERAAVAEDDINRLKEEWTQKVGALNDLSQLTGSWQVKKVMELVVADQPQGSAVRKVCLQVAALTGKYEKKFDDAVKTVNDKISNLRRNGLDTSGVQRQHDDYQLGG